MTGYHGLHQIRNILEMNENDYKSRVNNTMYRKCQSNQYDEILGFLGNNI